MKVPSGLNHNSPLVLPNKYPIILIISPDANPEISFVGTPLSPTYKTSPIVPKSDPYLNIPLIKIPLETAAPNANPNRVSDVVLLSLSANSQSPLLLK